MDKETVAKTLEYTMLGADTTHAKLQPLCDAAKANNAAAVCVNSLNVYFVHKQLKGSNVKTCSVVGFPFGATASAAKAFEAACAIEDGADEIDMVMDIASAKVGDWRRVEDDIAIVLDACDNRAKLKVIIECCLLTDDEKVKACLAAKRAGAHFVKTSTGYSSGGATVSDVKLMRDTVGNDMGVKAAGGIRDYETACAMIEAGADRIGTSHPEEILK